MPLTDEQRERMRKLSESTGGSYLSDSPDHPMFKRGYTIISGPAGKKVVGQDKPDAEPTEQSETVQEDKSQEE